MKKNVTLSFLLSLIFCLSASAQTIEKTVLEPRDPLSGYYLTVEPLSGEVEAVLLLLPGFMERPESIFTESMLPYTAAANNIFTVAVAGGKTVFPNEDTLAKIQAAIDDVTKKDPGLRSVNWVLGGFSAGGTIGLRYVEHCEEKGGNCPVDFSGVFTVDAPLDLIHLWEYCEKEMERGYSEVGIREAEFVSSLMKQQEGTPEDQPERYKELTPFTVAVEQGNEVHLKDIAVRTYHDVDINWLLQNRRRSAYDSNFLNASELIKRLLLLGNEQAEFVQSKQKGYRSNGTRHTHAWSIVDEMECVQWIKGIK